VIHRISYTYQRTKPGLRDLSQAAPVAAPHVDLHPAPRA
jgi:hypothetical protein